LYRYIMIARCQRYRMFIATFLIAMFDSSQSRTHLCKLTFYKHVNPLDLIKTTGQKFSSCKEEGTKAPRWCAIVSRSVVYTTRKIRAVAVVEIGRAAPQSKRATNLSAVTLTNLTPNIVHIVQVNLRPLRAYRLCFVVFLPPRCWPQ